ncbi:MAG: uroporphyrinogen-III C-methyltransferase [Candidatus Electryoneaceae bacterium]|nr:uroporphyrinogen-III C-methyltransferase [Candidatus Electryoneaceae bacterium]
MKMGKTGTVYLVGAVPGHPGLITRIGYDLLQRCDVVAYDALTPMELIAELPQRIERYYVGKRAGRHSADQDETNDLLIDLARRGLDVVRLKGGDPMIFGRGGEEVSFLKKAGVPVVIVPGVTAATAAAAGTGIPLTDRRAASWVVLGTGHPADSSSPNVPWDQFSRLGSGTIVIYMGVNSLEQIIDQLLAGGAPYDTPAAIVSNAYSGNQRVVYALLSDLAEKSTPIETPALIIVGEAVRYESSFGEMEPGRLAGKRILVTRPAGQTKRICRLLRDHGAEPIPLPTIQIESADDLNGWSSFAQAKAKGGWCVFTSEAGVNHFFRRLRWEGYDFRALGRFRIAVIGSGTVRALSSWGMSADLISEISTVKGLADTLAGEAWLDGVNVVRVRGNLGNNAVEEKSAQLGARVIPLTVYQNRPARWEEHWIEMISENPPDFITFTSGSTALGFVHIFGEELAIDVTGRSRVATIGPMTAETVLGLGMRVDVVADQYNVEGLVDAMVEYNNNGNK